MLGLPLKTITSRHNPLVAMFRAAERSGRTDRRYLLLDGLHLIGEAHQAGLPLEVVVLSISLLRQRDATVHRLVRHLETSGVEIVAASANVVDAVSPVRSPSGAVALARHEPTSMEHLFGRPGPVLAVVGVQDPGNVGAIIRAADAGEAGGVLVTQGSAEPFGWKALRGAMGSTFRIPVIDDADIGKAVDTARRHGAAILAAVPRGGVSLYDADLSGAQLVLIGGEGAGLDDDALDLADAQVSIPMRREVESLNTAVAAALIVYEARRQRLAAGRRHSEAAS